MFLLYKVRAVRGVRRAGTACVGHASARALILRPSVALGRGLSTKCDVPCFLDLHGGVAGFEMPRTGGGFVWGKFETSVAGTGLANES